MNYRVLLVISGSIAAYKSLELIRLMRKEGLDVTAILTAGGAQFITPLSVSSLSGSPTYTELWSLKDEVEMGHIRLSREADVIVIAPASADFIAKMAQGRADDLASTVLLAANRPILLAPAMNAQMWQHPATQRNVNQLQHDGVQILAPDSGELACGEVGDGRMAEPVAILRAVQEQLSNGPLSGRHVIITAGPTHEPIDPVRYLGNRSSGKQGYAVAAELTRLGAKVTLVSGPTALPCPRGVTRQSVETAQEMLEAVHSALPADAFIAAAAVADWKPDAPSLRKLKKRNNHEAPMIKLAENPDILASINQCERRPTLVIGFAAETENLEQEAKEKRLRKGADWMLANNVANGEVFGQEDTSLLFITAESPLETWENISKDEAARRLVEKMIAFFSAAAPSKNII